MLLEQLITDLFQIRDSNFITEDEKDEASRLRIEEFMLEEHRQWAQSEPMEKCYPYFVRQKNGSLKAFLAPDRMFLLKKSYGNGFEFRIYESTLVKNHETDFGVITFEEFAGRLHGVFDEYLHEIMELMKTTA